MVIAILCLLMALLLPVAQRIRRQGRSVVCQSNLRQWGQVAAEWTFENAAGPTRERLKRWYASGERGQGYESVAFDSPDHNDILLCPMTRKPTRLYFPRQGGGALLAWVHAKRPDQFIVGSDASYFGSYGLNAWIYYEGVVPSQPIVPEPINWVSQAGRAADVPLLLDCRVDWVRPTPTDKPLRIDSFSSGMPWACMDRHDRGINGLFMDWSVRRVGLKELWDLKWHREYDTAGPWTRAGGVKPEDWPPWMRSFKDY
jgi:prepilin-type processing-associated H-X9-DG protein